MALTSLIATNRLPLSRIRRYAPTKSFNSQLLVPTNTFDLYNGRCCCHCCFVPITCTSLICTMFCVVLWKTVGTMPALHIVKLSYSPEITTKPVWGMRGCVYLIWNRAPRCVNPVFPGSRHARASGLPSSADDRPRRPLIRCRSWV